MSLLPQRKKSPEEIAKLRESLGVPGASVEVNQAAGVPANGVDKIVPASDGTKAVHNDESAANHPSSGVAAPRPKPVHSLKRSERVTAPPAIPVSTPAPSVAPGAKSVRSLRKSEQVPAPAGHHPESPPDSNLPHRRHSDDEIAEIRRREVLSLMNAQLNPRLLPAHPALIISGYLSTVAGAVGLYFYQLPIVTTAACTLVSLLVSGFIFLRKPISRHHAAFIAAFALFLLVFSSLHYFPSLRHAT